MSVEGKISSYRALVKKLVVLVVVLVGVLGVIGGCMCIRVVVVGAVVVVGGCMCTSARFCVETVFIKTVFYCTRYLFYS